MSRRSRKKKIIKGKIELTMQCSPKCNYFPDMTCYSYKYDENGLKRRNDGKKFICAFDGHEIKSWYDKCPLK